MVWDRGEGEEDDGGLFTSGNNTKTISYITADEVKFKHEKSAKFMARF